MWGGATERVREREREREKEREKKVIVLVMATVQFVSLLLAASGCFLNRASVSKECVCKSRKRSERARGKLRDTGLMCWEKRGEERRREGDLFENE